MNRMARTIKELHKALDDLRKKVNQYEIEGNKKIDQLQGGRK